MVHQLSAQSSPLAEAAGVLLAQRLLLERPQCQAERLAQHQPRSLLEARCSTAVAQAAVWLLAVLAAQPAEAMAQSAQHQRQVARHTHTSAERLVLAHPAARQVLSPFLTQIQVQAVRRTLLAVAAAVAAERLRARLDRAALLAATVEAAARAALAARLAITNLALATISLAMVATQGQTQEQAAAAAGRAMQGVFQAQQLQEQQTLAQVATAAMAGLSLPTLREDEAMRYAFLNAESIVVNVIAGNLTPEQQQLFLRDQAALFGATQVIQVEPDTSVWIGGTYDAAQGFLPPPPEIVEGTSEVIEEPVAMIEETTPEPEATEPDL